MELTEQTTSNPQPVSRLLPGLGGLLAGGSGIALISALAFLVGGPFLSMIVLGLLICGIIIFGFVGFVLTYPHLGALMATRHGLFKVSATLGSLVLALVLIWIVFTTTFDTRYAPGYSESAFRSIEVGDSREEVVSRLGQPLSISDQDRESRLFYSTSPSDTNYFLRIVILDAGGHVKEIVSETYWD